MNLDNIEEKKQQNFDEPPQKLEVSLIFMILLMYYILPMSSIGNMD